MSSSSRSPSPRNQNYTWVNGFIDFFGFVRENLLFSILFVVFHSFIAYSLIFSHDKRMSEFQKHCSEFGDHPNEYFNGTNWLPNPEGDLAFIYTKIIDFVNKTSATFVEDVLDVAEGATLEQVEAAVQIKKQFIVHNYNAIISCNEVQPNKGLLTISLIYVFAFSIFIIYFTSPFGKIF